MSKSLGDSVFESLVVFAIFLMVLVCGVAAVVACSPGRTMLEPGVYSQKNRLSSVVLTDSDGKELLKAWFIEGSWMSFDGELKESISQKLSAAYPELVDKDFKDKNRKYVVKGLLKDD